MESQIKNPNGLHARYEIRKIKHVAGKPNKVFVEPVAPNSEYFVLRLDIGGKDIEHIKAGRVGIHAYAEAIKHHLPELAKDLIERYPLL